MPLLRSCVALIVFAATTSAAEPAKLRTLSGKTHEGELVRISNKEIVLHGDSGDVSIPLETILDLSLPSTAPASEDVYSNLQLTDGSLLHCLDFAIVRDEVRCKLVGGQAILIPLQTVANFVAGAQDPQVGQEWQGILSRQSNLDLLAIKDSAGKVNILEGTFGSGDDQGTSIQFESSSGAKRQINLRRIHGMSFVRKLDKEAPASICKVTDNARQTWMAATVSFAGGRFTLATPAGAKIELALPLVTRLDFSQGKLSYLSDLEPVRVVETSNVDAVEHYRRDRNLENAPLQLATTSDGRTEAQTYSKGLALHASTELVYDIGGRYKEFKAVVGVDPGVGGDSNVKLAIEGDGRSLLAADVRRGENPRQVICDVRDVRQLRITVRPAGLLDLGNHLNLADARVTK